MVLDESGTPLVRVGPDDRAETILERARAAGAPSVGLLVPEGVLALQHPAEAMQLAALAAEAGISLVLISSDPVTLTAARLGNIPAVPADEAWPAAAPAPPARPASPYSTRVLDPEPGPAAPPDPDRAFLSGLDELDGLPPADPRRAREEEAAAAASLAAALREPRPAPRAALSDDELLAATLAAEPGLTPPRVARPAPSVREASFPEAANTSSREAASSSFREAASFPEAPAPGFPEAAPAPRPAPRRAPPPRPVGRPPAGAAPAPRTWPIVALALALLVLLGVVGAVLLWNSRVTVTATPPPRPDTVEPISALPVPLVAPGAAAPTAVEAEAVRSQVAFSVEGEVSEGTLTPAGSAGGTLSIFNSTSQAVTLPAGTEFVAVLGDGREVPFVSTAEVLVPGATTSDTGAQVITSRGQASVPVVARSPGSGSNVEGNTVRRVVPPGGAGFNVDTGGFIVQHPPLTGGSEEEVRVVKDSNVQALLAPALEGLDAEARSQLEGLAQARGLTLDRTTIVPRRAELEQLQGFECVVQPGVGQTLDPANPRFTLTVQAGYSALAVPADGPLDQQLGPVLTEQLLQAGRISAGDCRAPAVTSWAWDGERLLVDGQIGPDTLSPGCQGGLDQAALDRVREAVRGKSRAEAQAALDALVAEGIIGGYTLPDVQQLPGWDWQLTVRG